MSETPAEPSGETPDELSSDLETPDDSGAEAGADGDCSVGSAGSGRVSQLAGLEERLGHRFAEPMRLEQALTHASFRNESSEAATDNERLEFLGDAVLELTVTEWLFTRHPEAREGQLTQLRARVVNTRELASTARQLGLGDILHMGVGEERSGGRRRRSLLADAIEAVLGAVFVDGGYEMARGVVYRLFEQRFEALAAEDVRDAKSRLQEWSQEHHRLTPRYRILSATGPGHATEFVAQVEVDEVVTAEGRGRSKKDAQQQAAVRALVALGLPVDDSALDEGRAGK